NDFDVPSCSQDGDLRLNESVDQALALITRLRNLHDGAQRLSSCQLEPPRSLSLLVERRLRGIERVSSPFGLLLLALVGLLHLINRALLHPINLSDCLPKPHSHFVEGGPALS